MAKNIAAIVALFLVFGLGIFAAKKYYQLGETVATQNSQVLLERMKSVAKVIAVEGYFSEIYTHEDYYNFDLSPFRKKALLRVKAKVSVGYNLENMKIEANDATKVISISNVPDPEILSIDHDVDYYDIQEGTFNSFTEQELTDLNRRAKKFIEEKAKSDELGLLPAAEEQKLKMLESMKMIANTAGYEVKELTVYEENNIKNILQN
ncbi:MAG: hypothetical protein ACI85O_002830 [Saprospiraceae bacterium]|jgi:hypothetical protein